MDDIEQHQCDEHEGGVENVLIRFVDRDTATIAFGILDQAEYDADLGQCKSCVCLGWLREE